MNGGAGAQPPIPSLGMRQKLSSAFAEFVHPFWSRGQQARALPEHSELEDEFA